MMTERDKIANVLNATELSTELKKADIYKLADALIAAGYGRDRFGDTSTQNSEILRLSHDEFFDVVAQVQKYGQVIIPIKED